MQDAPRWYHGLGLRAALLMTLALLPLGLIALDQTRRLTEETRRNAEMRLIALTEQAANAEGEAMQRAFGAADALGTLILLTGGDPATCRAALGEYLDNSATYSFIGLIPPDGRVRCSSAGGVLDVSENEGFTERMETPRGLVRAAPDALVSGEPVLLVQQPLIREGRFLGYVSVSLPSARLSLAEKDLDGGRPEALLTFNMEGDVLTAEGDREAALALLPRNRSLKALGSERPVVFEDVDSDGGARVFSVATVVPGTVRAIGVWPADAVAVATTLDPALPAWLFPMVMWLASLGTAVLAMHRLVVRHIRRLGRQMRRFAADRTLPQDPVTEDMSGELVRMEQTFLSMARSILHDEARLEDALFQKQVLMREVHHRVKNNLQLISSIMNMQMRTTSDPETRAILSRLQERILGLATVHRKLYEAENLGRLDAGRLLDDLIAQMMVIASSESMEVDLEKDLASIDLVPDQAVPLALLVAEGLTNALKNVAPAPGQARPVLRVVFRREPDGTALFELTNPLDPTPEPSSRPGSGLGTQLIRAFARQLEAEIEGGPTGDGRYRLSIRFPVIAAQGTATA
ncbi:MAG: sensor histidine kinase [Paracoccaceae bacterium]